MALSIWYLITNLKDVFFFISVKKKDWNASHGIDN